MNRKILLISVFVVATLLLLSASASVPSFALDATSIVNLSLSSGPVGSLVTVSGYGAGFPAGANPFGQIKVYWNNLDTQLTTYTYNGVSLLPGDKFAAADGSYRATIIIPASIEGINYIIVQDSLGMQAGIEFTVNTLFTNITTASSFKQGDTIWFDIKTNDPNVDSLNVMIKDPIGTYWWGTPDLAIVWPVVFDLQGNGYTPFALQLAYGLDNMHLTLPANAPLGPWTWTISVPATATTALPVRSGIFEVTTTDPQPTPTPSPEPTPTASPEPAAALTVNSPNGGQSWVRSSFHSVTWNSAGSVGDYVKIELLKGGVVNRVLASSTPNDGSWDWTIPSSQTVGTNYQIRITSTSTSIGDSSDSNFAIKAGTLTVTAPNGGQSWRHGTIHTITWSKLGNPGSYVKIELLKGGVVNRIIASSTANDGSYSWYIPSGQTLGTDYKIRITSTTYSSIRDSSNSNFKIIT